MTIIKLPWSKYAISVYYEINLTTPSVMCSKEQIKSGLRKDRPSMDKKRLKRTRDYNRDSNEHCTRTSQTPSD